MPALRTGRHGRSATHLSLKIKLKWCYGSWHINRWGEAEGECCMLGGDRPKHSLGDMLRVAVPGRVQAKPWGFLGTEMAGPVEDRSEEWNSHEGYLDTEESPDPYTDEPTDGYFFLILQKIERFISKISCCLHAIMDISGFISSVIAFIYRNTAFPYLIFSRLTSYYLNNVSYYMPQLS